MTPVECCREVDVIDAVTSRRWPDRADADLRAHVAACAICADVADVASALQDDREAAFAAPLPLLPADVVWFRAQARARAEAARQAARPIAVMQGIGLAVATAVISLLIGVVAVWVWQRADVLVAWPTLDPFGLDSMSMAIRGVLLAVGLWLVLAPVAVYFAATED